MFIGHWAPALIAAGASRRAPPLPVLFIAAQLVDWGLFSLGLLGIEHMRFVPGLTRMNPLDLYFMPYTHSLLAAAIWALLFALAILAWRHNPAGSLLAGLVVLMHWPLDLLVHAPDLTIAGGATKYGLGLWNHPAIAMALELALVLGAFVYYERRTKGPIGPLIILIAIMLLLQGYNWFGPEPGGSTTIFYIMGMVAFAVVTFFSGWVEKTRWHKGLTGLAVATMHR